PRPERVHYRHNGVEVTSRYMTVRGDRYEIDELAEIMLTRGTWHPGVKIGAATAVVEAAVFAPLAGVVTTPVMWLIATVALSVPCLVALPAQRLELQLAYPLAGQRELRRDLGERVLAPVLQPVPGPHDPGRAVVEVPEQALDPLPLQRAEDDVLGRGRVGVGDQVAEIGVAVVADRRVQRDGVLRPAHQLQYPVQRHTQRDGHLLRLRVAAQLARELSL